MLHFIDHVLVLYIQTTREMLGFDSSQHALALFDVFAAHCCDSVLQALERNNIKCCFIPANCIGELQPLDVTVNQMFKLELKACFTKWYAGLVKEQLEHGVQSSKLHPAFGQFPCTLLKRPAVILRVRFQWPIKVTHVLCSFRGGSASLVGLKRRHNTQSEAGNAKKRVTHDTFMKWKRDLDRECQTVFEVVALV